MNFDGWNCKWDEWIPISSGRVRTIQHPDALSIRRDGSPVYLCSKMKVGKEIEAQDVEGGWYRAKVVEKNDARNMVRGLKEGGGGCVVEGRGRGRGDQGGRREEEEYVE